MSETCTEKDAPVCERVCEYALDVGLPEYSGLANKPEGCGNCAHYQPSTETCPHPSSTGIDQTPWDDPDKVWECHQCGDMWTDRLRGAS